MPSSNKSRRHSGCGDCYKSDHNLKGTKSKCKWGMYTNYEKIKLTTSSTTFKTTYHSGSYLIFGKRNLQSFKISGE